MNKNTYICQNENENSNSHCSTQQIIQKSQKSIHSKQQNVLESLEDESFENKQVKPWIVFISGFFAGVFSRTTTAPLDRVKVLMQAQAKRGITLREGIFQIYLEGGLKSFFKGNGTNVIKVAPETALKFLFFDKIKHLICQDPSNPKTYERLLAGGGAGALSSFIIYPLEVIKTRLSLQKPPLLYNGIIDCTIKMIRQEGFKSLYRGLTPSIVGIIPYASIDLTVYNTLREYYINHHTNNPSTFILMVCGGISTTCGQLVSYPFSLIRTRLQSQGMQGIPKYYTGMVDCAFKIMKYEGISGYYKGLLPNFMKALPAVSISYGTFEYIKKLLVQAEQY